MAECGISALGRECVHPYHSKNMALVLHVPTLSSPESVKSLEETIRTTEPDANLQIDLDSKTVTITSQASEETFKQLIVAAGHQISPPA